VQVAGGADKTLLTGTWASLKQKHKSLMEGRSAYTTPLRFTNRLLVGPFKSQAEAQAFVNKSGSAGISAFSYKSPAGQDIEKLGGK
jgi:hypothetical protein